MNITHEMMATERSAYIVTLVHDEYMDSVIEGHDEVYEEWAQFAGQLIVETLLPNQRIAS